MGCDIHIHTEVRNPTTKIWEEKCGDFSEGAAPFDWRGYGMFSFLTGGVVRNYSGIEGLGIKPRGYPGVDDSSADDLGDYHSHSWLTLKELLDFNYTAEMEDRRCMRNGNGGCTCEPGEGEKQTWIEFLGPHFMQDLEKLKTFGNPEDVRIVFCFDN